MTALKTDRKPRTPEEVVGSLLKILDLEQTDTDRFLGQSSPTPWGRVYGGQVLAQALIAGTRTVGPERPAHSLHGYFILGGDPALPITFSVDRVRDGGSFATRRVTALQRDKAIFEMLCSFHKLEGGFEHSAEMPVVPPPESLETIGQLLARPDAQAPDTMRFYYNRERPFELKLVTTDRYFGGQNLPARQMFWLKTAVRLDGDQPLHNALLAYASDFAMIDTALIPHGKLMFDPQMQLASLDHALWLHAPFRADDWLLYVLDGPKAGRGRAFARGSFFTRDGVLVASTAQEGLARERSTSFVLK